MEWGAHPIATADDEILRKIVHFFGNDIAVFGSAAFVCRAWLRVVREVALARPLYRFGDIAVQRPDVAILPALQPRSKTRAYGKRLRDEAEQLADAARTITCGAWHPVHTNYFVIGFADGTLCSWSARNGLSQKASIRYVMEGDFSSSTRAVTQFAFSRDGEWGVCGNMNGTTESFRPRVVDGELYLNYTGSRIQWGDDFVTWCEFVADTSRVATCVNEVIVWEADTGEEVWRHTPGAACVRFSPDGNTSATLAFDATLHMHDVSSRDRLALIHLAPPEDFPLRDDLFRTLAAMVNHPGLGASTDGIDESVADVAHMLHGIISFTTHCALVLPVLGLARSLQQGHGALRDALVAEIENSPNTVMLRTDDASVTDATRKCAWRGFIARICAVLTGRDSCARCGEPIENEAGRKKACALCHTVVYCGRECQKAHWTASHKAACRCFCAQIIEHV